MFRTRCLQVTLENQGEALVLSFGASAHMDNAALIEKRLYSNLAMHKVQVSREPVKWKLEQCGRVKGVATSITSIFF